MGFNVCFVSWYLLNREREIRGKYFRDPSLSAVSLAADTLLESTDPVNICGLSLSAVSLVADALLESTDPVNSWSLVNTGRIFLRVRDLLLVAEIRFCPETFRLLGLDFEPAEDISKKNKIYPKTSFLIPISLKLFLEQHFFYFTRPRFHRRRCR